MHEHINNNYNYSLLFHFTFIIHSQLSFIQQYQQQSISSTAISISFIQLYQQQSSIPHFLSLFIFLLLLQFITISTSIIIMLSNYYYHYSLFIIHYYSCTFTIASPLSMIQHTKYTTTTTTNINHNIIIISYSYCLSLLLFFVIFIKWCNLC